MIAPYRWMSDPVPATTTASLYHHQRERHFRLFRLLRRRHSTTTNPSSSSSGLPYELFALLMHSGSAMAGHYFAFIKELHTGEWLKFNDSHVSKASEEEIDAATGGKRGGGTGPSTHMLFYRKVDESIARHAKRRQRRRWRLRQRRRRRRLRRRRGRKGRRWRCRRRRRSGSPLVPVPPGLKELVETFTAPLPEAS